ncbi:GntP family gluconate:H+ symporter [Tamaricihabitans halophyticus]|uniref:GntP family gluconate:H+ symporter n=1 Tax=Tamaricihabitans halophyticus TaxID=1262583 RepID=A0A4R2R9K0_9PSEU|nr:gluconate:H+ symporter [Tamaricihabitans halophyticus]TCP56075.1 GntP family gluconate:H+ symporter [Tamaricihabitans halophyticus]
MTLAAPAEINEWQLTGATLLGIAVLVVLITKFKLHPFLALILGSGVIGLVAGMPVDMLVESFTAGLGETIAGVGALIALGAMLGKLLADSGGADQIVDTILTKARGRGLPWALAGVAALIGLPMFFEIGLVMLVPVVLLIVRRSGQPMMRLAIPALAGLSVLHGLVPPHPGPLVAVDALNADLGLTLGLGILVAIPTVAIAGPMFSVLAAKWVDAAPPDALVPESKEDDSTRRPSFAATLFTVLLPVVLMLGKAIAAMLLDEQDTVRRVLDFVGDPLVALLAAVLVGMFTLGRGAGFGLSRIDRSIADSLLPIGGLVLIVGAGGGLKQILVDAGFADLIVGLSQDANIDPLLLGWLIAVAIRLATGSATVATISASGMVVQLTAGMDPLHTSLLALAIGAGSLFFSHVNDSGFWLVKEYFGLSVGQTIKTWSVMETLISVVGLAIILPIGWLF